MATITTDEHPAHLSDEFREFCVQVLTSTERTQAQRAAGYRDGTRCALGVIAEAAGFPLVEMGFSYFVDKLCISCEGANFIRERMPRALWNDIPVWNDKEGLTFDQIAKRIKDWQPAKEPGIG